MEAVHLSCVLGLALYDLQKLSGSVRDACDFALSLYPPDEYFGRTCSPHLLCCMATERKGRMSVLQVIVQLA